MLAKEGCQIAASAAVYNMRSKFSSIQPELAEVCATAAGNQKVNSTGSKTCRIRIAVMQWYHYIVTRHHWEWETAVHSA